MDLADAIREEQQPKHVKSVVEVWIETLPEKDQKTAIEALLSDSASTMSLYRVFQRFGATFGKTSLSNYRTQLRDKQRGNA